ncbi:uncharacterized protein [Notamacropus eugenii]|uniref:uncharacterized protein n=1 Tax=Notamacropus eugenii TaxID=9315 RepID=UPI003B66D803
MTRPPQQRRGPLVGGAAAPPPPPVRGSGGEGGRRGDFGCPPGGVRGWSLDLQASCLRARTQDTASARGGEGDSLLEPEDTEAQVEEVCRGLPGGWGATVRRRPGPPARGGADGHAHRGSRGCCLEEGLARAGLETTPVALVGGGGMEGVGPVRRGPGPEGARSGGGPVWTGPASAAFDSDLGPRPAVVNGRQGLGLRLTSRRHRDSRTGPGTGPGLAAGEAEAEAGPKPCISVLVMNS